MALLYAIQYFQSQVLSSINNVELVFSNAAVLLLLLKALFDYLPIFQMMLPANCLSNITQLFLPQNNSFKNYFDGILACNALTWAQTPVLADCNLGSAK